MKPLNIAIISDLHVGNKARSKDLRVTGQEQAVDRDYKINFLKFLQKHKVKADYLLIPGDIANQAEPAEFLLASTVISDIAKTLSITKKRSFLYQAITIRIGRQFLIHSALSLMILFYKDIFRSGKKK